MNKGKSTGLQWLIVVLTWDAWNAVLACFSMSLVRMNALALSAAVWAVAMMKRLKL